MDLKRINEILSSTNMINVFYKGKPVYLENVDAKLNMVQIHYMNEPVVKQDVEISELKETGQN